MSWHILKLDLNSAWWMPKLVSIDAQSYPALTSQSLRTTIGPLQDNWPLFHYVIGISGILPYNRNVTLQTFELFSAFARLDNAAALPASHLRSAGSLAINQSPSVKTSWHLKITLSMDSKASYCTCFVGIKFHELFNGWPWGSTTL